MEDIEDIEDIENMEDIERFFFLHRSISKIWKISKIPFFFYSPWRENYNIIVDCPGCSIDKIKNRSEI